MVNVYLFIYVKKCIISYKNKILSCNKGECRVVRVQAVVKSLLFYVLFSPFIIYKAMHRDAYTMDILMFICQCR